MFNLRIEPPWIFSYIAITSIGAIAVPLNSWWQAKELEYALTHSDSKIFIGDEELSRQSVTLRNLDDGSQTEVSFSELKNYLQKYF